MSFFKEEINLLYVKYITTHCVNRLLSLLLSDVGILCLYIYIYVCMSYVHVFVYI